MTVTFGAYLPCCTLKTSENNTLLPTTRAGHFLQMYVSVLSALDHQSYAEKVGERKQIREESSKNLMILCHS